MTPKPPNNDRFLSAIFGSAISQTFTASFRGPMASANWNRNPFASDPGSNNYFCVSTIGGDGRRTPENCTALHVILVDDVGTKVDAARPTGILGAPTYIIETSPGNEQWGYVLSPPCTDPATAEALVRGAKELFTADAAGRNRLARLPYGTNGKNGYNTKLILWEPQKTLTPEQAFINLEATPVPQEELIHSDALPREVDPIVQAMELTGHPFTTTRTPGLYTVQCPWLADHSDGRDDGAAYISPAGFKCHHGHCANKTFRDFRKYLGVGAAEVDDKIAEAAFGMLNLKEGTIAKVSGFVTDPYPDQTFVLRDGKFEPTQKQGGVTQSVGAEEPVQKPVGAGGVAAPLHPWLSETPKQFTVGDRFMTRAELQKAFPRLWLFKDTIPMNVPWALVGEGGLGKSRIALAMCMSIATGVPFGPDFVPELSEGAPAVFLTQEDDKPDGGFRFLTQYEYLCERDARWRPDKIFHRLCDNLFVPSLLWGQHLDIEFRHRYQAFLGALSKPVRLVMYDPFVLFMDHTDEQASINSAAGAINTMSLLIKTTKAGQDDIPFSAGMCHHMNKIGEIYGSALIRAHLRVVFDVLKTEDPQTTLMKVSKVNSSPIMGKEWKIALADETAAVYPSEGEEFGEQTDEEKLATLLHTGAIPWDVPQSKLISAAKKFAMFGDIDEREERLGNVLFFWHKDQLGSVETLANLGLEHAKYGRFKPVVKEAE